MSANDPQVVLGLFQDPPVDQTGALPGQFDVGGAFIDIDWRIFGIRAKGPIQTGMEMPKNQRQNVLMEDMGEREAMYMPRKTAPIITTLATMRTMLEYRERL